MCSSQQLIHPLVPLTFEIPQEGTPLPLLQQAVVDGVKSSQLEVLNCPIVGDQTHEEVSSAVLDPQLASIAHPHTHSVPQAEQDRGRRLAGVASVTAEQVGKRALLEADEPTVGEEFDALGDVESVADPHAARHHCLLDVARLEVPALPRVVCLPQTQ